MQRLVGVVMKIFLIEQVLHAMKTQDTQVGSTRKPSVNYAIQYIIPEGTLQPVVTVAIGDVN